MNWLPVLLLLMLCAANSAPVVAAWLLGQRWNLPVDLGRTLRDGRPLFGPAKTWRGLASALLACWLLARVSGLGEGFGLSLGAMAMAGDLLSSFVKRRRGLASSARSLGWDQLPESLLPSIYAVCVLDDLPWWWAALLPLIFTAAALLVSRPLYRLGIRKRPY